MKRLSLAVVHDPLQVIYQISLHAIDHFKIRILRNHPAPGIETMIRLRESLHHSVVGNGNGFMSPLIGSFDNGFRVGNSVHVAHLGMAVKFHSFLRAVVHTAVLKAGDLLDPYYGTDRQFTVIPVNGGNPFQFNESFHLHSLQDLLYLVVSGKDLYSDRVGKICNRKDDNGLLIPDLSGLQGHNLSPDTDLPHFCLDTFQRNDLILKVSSIEHIRIIRALHAPLKVAETSVSSGSSLISLKGFSEFRTIFFFFLLFGLSILFFCLCFFLRGFLFLILVFTGGLEFFFSFVLSERRHLDNMSRFLLKLDLAVFPDLAFFGFLVLRLHLQRKGAALAENLFYVLDQLIFLALCQYVGLEHHMHGICLRKRNNSIPEHIKYQNAVMFQFQRHGRTVCVQKKLRRILAGEIKLLQYFHFHGHSRKTLGRNGVFQGIDVFFMNPLPAADIDPDMILSLVDSHLSDYYLFQESPQFSFQFQIPEHFQKFFLHEAMPPLIISNFPVPGEAPKEAGLQGPSG